MTTAGLVHRFGLTSQLHAILQQRLTSPQSFPRRPARKFRILFCSERCAKTTYAAPPS